jgi:hypothetical protein
MQWRYTKFQNNNNNKKEKKKEKGVKKIEKLNLLSQRTSISRSKIIYYISFTTDMFQYISWHRE